MPVIFFPTLDIFLSTSLFARDLFLILVRYCCVFFLLQPLRVGVTGRKDGAKKRPATLGDA